MRIIKYSTLLLCLLFLLASIYYIACKPIITPPIAKIEVPSYVRINTDVALDGSGSVVFNGEYLHYQWFVSDQPEPVPPFDDVFSSNSEIARMHPTKLGKYTVKLRVEDNDAEEDIAFATFQVAEANTTVVAIAETFSVLQSLNTIIHVDGGKSYDVLERTLIFNWQFLSKPGFSNAIIENSDKEDMSYIMDEPGVYIVELTVSAGDDSDKDTVETRVYPPRIQSVSSNSGEIGTEVIITGLNFSQYINGNIVSFNSTTAVVQSINDGEITTSVPAGATSGNITIEIVETGETDTWDYEFIITGPDFFIDIAESFGVAQGKSIDVTTTIDRIGGHAENIDLSMYNIYCTGSI